MTLRQVVILAGGASTRMGMDKAALPLQGRSLLEQVVSVVQRAGLRVRVVGRDRPATWGPSGVDFQGDAHPGQGPLPALLQVLSQTHEAVLVLACDLPRLAPELVEHLTDQWNRTPAPLGMICSIAGAIQPVSGVYAPAAAAHLATALERGERSLRRLILGHPGFIPLELPPALAGCLEDCDTPEQWARLSRPDDASPG